MSSSFLVGVLIFNMIISFYSIQNFMSQSPKGVSKVMGFLPTSYFSQVEILLYDISKGMAAKLGPLLLGKSAEVPTLPLCGVGRVWLARVPGHENNNHEIC